ncbi:MAG: hypothetical protein Q8N18_05055 [Opitutaceae bacterium]|nr:hypothetical protein [Opitutaceae bacterium]
MSTSTSLRSERLTALLWGDRWWIEGRTEPVPFGDLHLAAEVFLAQFGADEKPAQVRLIFQPASLAAVSVACPKSDRETMRLALSEQFPALAEADLAWGHEPVFGVDPPFATVLYHEMQAGLFALVAELRASGIVVESAWPLATALNFVPDDWPDSGAMIVVAAAENHTLVYRHTVDGRREVESAIGSDATDCALRGLRAALARTDTAVFLVGCETAGERLAAKLPTPDVPRVRLVSWSRLATAVATLPLKHPAQLLPVEPRWSAHRALLVTAGFAAMVAIGLLADAARVESKHREAVAADHRAATALRAELVARQSDAHELASLRLAVEAGEPAHAVFTPWLRATAVKLPPEVVLTRIAATRTSVTMVGGITGKLGEAPWREWTTAVAAAGSAWRFPERPPLPTASFQLTATALR